MAAVAVRVDVDRPAHAVLFGHRGRSLVAEPDRGTILEAEPALIDEHLDVAPRERLAREVRAVVALVDENEVERTVSIQVYAGERGARREAAEVCRQR